MAFLNDHSAAACVCTRGASVMRRRRHAAPLSTVASGVGAEHYKAVGRGIGSALLCPSGNSLETGTTFTPLPGAENRSGAEVSLPAQARRAVRIPLVGTALITPRLSPPARVMGALSPGLARRPECSSRGETETRDGLCGTDLQGAWERHYLGIRAVTSPRAVHFSPRPLLRVAESYSAHPVTRASADGGVLCAADGRRQPSIGLCKRKAGQSPGTRTVRPFCRSSQR
jgi:hypothetical protein